MSKELAARMREAGLLSDDRGELPEFTDTDDSLTSEDIEPLRDGHRVPTRVDSWEELWDDYYAYRG
jgi:hypothetical protein